MSEKFPKLSRKWRIFEKLLYTLANAKTILEKVPEYLGTGHVIQKL